MSYWRLSFCLGLLLLFSCQDHNETENPFLQETIPWPSLADSPWPMHHGNPQSTGRFEGLGAPNGEILWEYESFGGYACSPVIGGNGTIYVVSAYDTTDDGNLNSILKAINPDGSLAWSKPLLDTDSLDYAWLVEVSPVIDHDDNIYVGIQNGQILKISSEGETLWVYRHSSQLFWGAFVLDLEGNLLTVDGDNNLISISPDGVLNWSVFGFDAYNSFFAISPDGDKIYLSGKDTDLIGLDIYGNELFRVPTEGHVTSPIAVTSEGNVIFGTKYAVPDGSSKLISMITGDGQTIWDYNNDELRHWTLAKGVTIDLDGNIIFEHLPKVYALDFDGNNLWASDTVTERGSWSNPVCDVGGNVFITAVDIGSNNRIYSIANDGTINWEINTGQYMPQFSPAFDANGVLYVVADMNYNGKYYSKLIAIY